VYPSPLAATPLLDPLATAVAQAHGISPAQALLAWQWAEGIPVNPRT